ncbi:MAG: HEPN domain-containing protein [Thermoplasmatota archaeon]
MSYEDYLVQADEELSAARLLSRKTFYREAASRAYYAMFHAAQAILLLKNVYPKSHAGVIRAFGETLVKPGILDKRMGQMLSQAASMRMKADYDVGVRVTKQECEETLSNAETFLQEISNAVISSGES